MGDSTYAIVAHPFARESPERLRLQVGRMDHEAGPFREILKSGGSVKMPAIICDHSIGDGAEAEQSFHDRGRIDGDSRHPPHWSSQLRVKRPSYSGGVEIQFRPG